MPLLLVRSAAVPLVLLVLVRRTSRARIGADLGLRPARLDADNGIHRHGFSKPIRMIFKALFRPRREVQAEYDFSPYFATTLRFESHIEERSRRAFTGP